MAASNMKKKLLLPLALLVILVVIVIFLYQTGRIPFIHIEIDKIISTSDGDRDGIPDSEELMSGARNEVSNRTQYRSAYYEGGYPPSTEGVCTDVLWRAFRIAGYDFKQSIDQDIRQHAAEYPGVNGKPDPNIDFRRVRNQLIFYQRNFISLTTRVAPYDKETLSQWQGGDIVTLYNPKRKTDHVAIISDKRRNDGIPYVIHNPGPKPEEADRLLRWRKMITGHFRIVPEKLASYQQ